MAFPSSDPEEARRQLQDIIDLYVRLQDPLNIDTAFVRSCTITAASLETSTRPASISYAFTIGPYYRNDPTRKTVHGGAIALFFDSCTCMPIFLAKRNWGNTVGVTRTLSVTLFHPAMEGDKVTLDAELVSIGKQVATVRGVLRRDTDGVILATCQHDRVAPTSQTGYTLKL